MDDIFGDLGQGMEPVRVQVPFRGYIRDIVSNGPQDGIAYLTEKLKAAMKAWPDGEAIRIDIPEQRFAYEDLCELNAFVFACLSWLHAAQPYERRS